MPVRVFAIHSAHQSMFVPLATSPTLLYGMPTAVALAAPCAVLSVMVVSRRWAFIGEGISHSGFGGAGTASMLPPLLPRLHPHSSPSPRLHILSPPPPIPARA